MKGLVSGKPFFHIRLLFEVLSYMYAGFQHNGLNLWKPYFFLVISSQGKVIGLYGLPPFDEHITVYNSQKN